MGAMGIWQWVIILAIVLILFGKGKISGLLGDLGKGVRSLKNATTDEPQEVASVGANKTEEQPHV